MKILIDVDLKIPRWVRVGSLLVVTAGLVATATMVSADVPNTFKTGDLLTAQKLNDNFSSQDARLTVLEAAPGLPSGTVVAFGGTAAPVGWLPCDGTSLDGTNAQYAALYAVIGTAFGGTYDIEGIQSPRFARAIPTGAPMAAGHKRSRRSIANGNAQPAGTQAPRLGLFEAGATALPTAPFSTDVAPDHTHASSNGAKFRGPGCRRRTDWRQCLERGSDHSSRRASLPLRYYRRGRMKLRPVNVAITYIIKL